MSETQGALHSTKLITTASLKLELCCSDVASALVPSRSRALSSSTPSRVHPKKGTTRAQCVVLQVGASHTAKRTYKTPSSTAGTSTPFLHRRSSATSVFLPKRDSSSSRRKGWRSSVWNASFLFSQQFDITSRERAAPLALLKQSTSQADVFSRIAEETSCYCTPTLTLSRLHASRLHSEKLAVGTTLGSVRRPC
ncbi:hypothetical protein IE81DRAFT_67725 [Ceraceosorus guamensis]|uniref:Uncharacterized protein n=1 Tax=Ceraceosorus guamensis TaxID=1522189 RepID=A0A316W1T8_9BASI|nr:hypothetical protein IE81DRAFT_67725 [Ceraceosorus guamensis]PWN43750.1 hypothetical protein IE81DRAFT_67725 [Ceraceosorus guamensis]